MIKLNPAWTQQQTERTHTHTKYRLTLICCLSAAIQTAKEMVGSWGMCVCGSHC